MRRDECNEERVMVVPDTRKRGRDPSHRPDWRSNSMLAYFSGGILYEQNTSCSTHSGKMIMKYKALIV